MESIMSPMRSCEISENFGALPIRVVLFTYSGKGKAESANFKVTKRYASCSNGMRRRRMCVLGKKGKRFDLLQTTCFMNPPMNTFVPAFHVHS